MRSVCILCLLFVESALSLCQSVPQSSSAGADVQREKATVGGYVFRLDSGEPLKKDKVSLQTHDVGYFFDFLLTDNQGHFLFDGAPAGSYDLRVSRNGFVGAEYAQKKPGTRGAILTLVPGQ